MAPALLSSRSGPVTSSATGPDTIHVHRQFAVGSLSPSECRLCRRDTLAADLRDPHRELVRQNLPEPLLGVARAPGVGQPGGRLGVDRPPWTQPQPALPPDLSVQSLPRLL